MDTFDIFEFFDSLSLQFLQNRISSRDRWVSRPIPVGLEHSKLQSCVHGIQCHIRGCVWSPFKGKIDYVPLCVQRVGQYILTKPVFFSLTSPRRLKSTVRCSSASSAHWGLFCRDASSSPCLEAQRVQPSNSYQHSSPWSQD